MKALSKELVLFVIAILCAIVPILLMCHLAVPHFLSGSGIAKFLSDDQVKNVASGLSVGYLAAYFFYLLNDYFPKRRSQEKAHEVIKSLLASIIEPYLNPNGRNHGIFSHKCYRNFLEFDLLDEMIQEQKTNISAMRDYQLSPLKIDFPKEHHDHSELSDVQVAAQNCLSSFQNVLPLVSSEMGPEHVLKWLIVTDKLSRLAKAPPVHPKPRVVSTNQIDEFVITAASILCTSSNFSAYLKAVKAWLLLDPPSNKASSQTLADRPRCS